jgi:hypothetical protein
MSIKLQDIDRNRLLYLDRHLILHTHHGLILSYKVQPWRGIIINILEVSLTLSDRN